MTVYKYTISNYLQIYFNKLVKLLKPLQQLNCKRVFMAHAVRG